MIKRLLSFSTFVLAIMVLIGCVASGSHSTANPSPGGNDLATTTNSVITGLGFLSWICIGGLALGIFEVVEGFLDGTSIRGGEVIAASSVISLILSILLQTYLKTVCIISGVLMLAALGYWILDCYTQKKIVNPLTVTVALPTEAK